MSAALVRSRLKIGQDVSDQKAKERGRMTTSADAISCFPVSMLFDFTPPCTEFLTRAKCRVSATATISKTELPSRALKKVQLRGGIDWSIARLSRWASVALAASPDWAVTYRSWLI